MQVDRRRGHRAAMLPQEGEVGRDRGPDREAQAKYEAGVHCCHSKNASIMLCPRGVEHKRRPEVATWGHAGSQLRDPGASRTAMRAASGRALWPSQPESEARALVANQDDITRLR